MKKFFNASLYLLSLSSLIGMASEPLVAAVAKKGLSTQDYDIVYMLKDSEGRTVASASTALIADEFERTVAAATEASQDAKVVIPARKVPAAQQPKKEEVKEEHKEADRSVATRQKGTN
jgi:hypothetical protein